MNISYEKSKLLKDIKTKYPRTNKNRFTRNLKNLLDLLNPHTPLQMVSEHSNLKSTEELYKLELELHLKKTFNHLFNPYLFSTYF